MKEAKYPVECWEISEFQKKHSQYEEYLEDNELFVLYYPAGKNFSGNMTLDWGFYDDETECDNEVEAIILEGDVHIDGTLYDIYNEGEALENIIISGDLYVKNLNISEHSLTVLGNIYVEGIALMFRYHYPYSKITAASLSAALVINDQFDMNINKIKTPCMFGGPTIHLFNHSLKTLSALLSDTRHVENNTFHTYDFRTYFNFSKSSVFIQDVTALLENKI